MKKLTSNIGAMTIALIFACLLSCNEQDERPVSQNRLDPNSPAPQFVKTRSASGRVGGEVFNSAVGGALDLTTATAWIANFREENPDHLHGHFFGSEIIQQILNEEGSVGIRIYYATDELGEKKLLINGVDAQGNDLLPSSGQMAGGGFTVADFSLPCPSYCHDEE